MTEEMDLQRKPNSLAERERILFDEMRESLTAKQFIVLEKLFEIEAIPETITELTEVLGISRVSWYTCLKDTICYSWKELRHTTASLMHRKGVPVLAIKDQLRHTNETTIDFYIGSDVKYQREQIEKLILNSGKKVGNDDFATPSDYIQN
jgi:hypothetical protein